MKKHVDSMSMYVYYLSFVCIHGGIPCLFTWQLCYFSVVDYISIHVQVQDIIMSSTSSHLRHAPDGTGLLLYIYRAFSSLCSFDIYR